MSARVHLKVSAALFAALFAAQGALIAMAPVLTAAAADLGVSTAAAGQLRTVAGLTAGVASVLLATGLNRLGLRRQLVAGAAIVALSSLAAAGSATYLVLLLAQVPLGVGVAMLTTAGVLAAAEWVPAELRTRTLSRALVGQPSAWIVGMPLVGVVGGLGWRYGWLVLPFAAACGAACLVARRRGADPPRGPSRLGDVVRDGAIRAWLGADLLSNAAWAGTLVYAGALYTESHGLSPAVAGALLAVAAVAHVTGNLASRRLVRRDPRRMLILLSAVLAAADLVFLALDCSAAVRTVLFSATALVAGGRTLVSSAFGLSLPAERRAGASSLRASTMYFGYFVGSSAGGAALAAGGYAAVGVVMASLFLAASLLLALPVAQDPARLALDAA